MKQNPIPKKSIAKKIIFIILAIIVVLSLALLILIPFLIMPSFLGQRYEQTQYDSLDYGIPSEQIALTSEDGLTLAAWRTRVTPTTQPKGTVIILSGIQNPSVTAFFGYAKLLADHGWDSLLIEMRARSQSEGEEIGLGMTEWRDVKAGMDFLSADEAVQDLPIVAMGTSMGGSTVIIAAGEVPEIDGVISISAFSSWTDLFIDNMTAMDMPQAIGKMEIPFLNLYLGIHYGFDALQYAPLNGIRKLADRPILMMHSTGDSQVPYSEFKKLREEAEKHSVNLTTFVREGDEHFVCYEPYFDDPSGDAEFSRALLDFLEVNF